MTNVWIASILAASLGGTATLAQDMPFGSAADAAYAKLIWDVMQANRLAGPSMIRSAP